MHDHFFVMPAYIEQYDIAFKGLKTGVHNFIFELEDDFFGHFNNPECPGGKISVNVEMDKKDHLLSLFCTYSGSVRVACDRCLEEFQLEMDFDSNLFVKFKDEETESDADVICIPVNEHKLSMADYFIESICLNLPFRKVHGKDQKGNDLCNKDMINKLNSHRVDEDDRAADPRWDKLRDMINKKN